MPISFWPFPNLKFSPFSSFMVDAVIFSILFDDIKSYFENNLC